MREIGFPRRFPMPARFAVPSPRLRKCSAKADDVEAYHVADGGYVDNEGAGQRRRFGSQAPRPLLFHKTNRQGATTL